MTRVAWCVAGVLLFVERSAKGLLYLRINDDILSDNRGAVVGAVTVHRTHE